jgi:hypothetical protein
MVIRLAAFSSASAIVDRMETHSVIHFKLVHTDVYANVAREEKRTALHEIGIVEPTEEDLAA